MLSRKTLKLIGCGNYCRSCILTSNNCKTLTSVKFGTSRSSSLHCPLALTFSKLRYQKAGMCSGFQIGRNCSSKSQNRPVVTTTMDEEELKHFQALAKSWWDETGDFEALHAMNKLRVPFIRDGLVDQNDIVESDGLPLKDLTIVDVGSGGGILSEPLARLGAFVIGLDPVEESTTIAQLHLKEDPRVQCRVKYINGSVEDLASTESEKFDAVVASEVVEHVADLVSFVESCCKLLKPGGSLFITTMNKTVLSKSLAVFAAEKVFKIVPEGTHDWEKFVPPEDLKVILENNNMDVKMIHGMLYLPVFREWKWVKDTSINYALHAVKIDPTDVADDRL
ncbi:Hexaprenyldihydroxybenzoate methyltransferase [Mactra antiquata]